MAANDSAFARRGWLVRGERRPASLCLQAHSRDLWSGEGRWAQSAQGQACPRSSEQTLPFSREGLPKLRGPSQRGVPRRQGVA